MADIKIKCENCNGTGTCPACHGSGKRQGIPHGQPNNCLMCQGSGKCPQCQGTGKRI